MALAEEFCQEWVQRQGPFKNKLEGALVLNFALCTIQHDLEEILDQLEWQPVFEGVSPREVYERGEYGHEPPKGLSDRDVIELVQKSPLNRFILESIFPDELVPGKYLGTKDVLEKVMDNMKSLGIKNVILVANPGHMFRCCELVEGAAFDQSMSLGIYAADCTRVCYDPDSAQSWTQTPLAFWEYDIISRARELALKQILDEKRKRDSRPPYR